MVHGVYFNIMLCYVNSFVKEEIFKIAKNSILNRAVERIFFNRVNRVINIINPTLTRYSHHITSSFNKMT